VLKSRDLNTVAVPTSQLAWLPAYAPERQEAFGRPRTSGPTDELAPPVYRVNPESSGTA